MKSVIYLAPNASEPCREKIAGIYRYLESSRADIQLTDISTDYRNIRTLLRKWNPAGCIVDRGLSTGKVPTRLFANIPTVYVDQYGLPHGEKVWCILHDSVATTRAAFDELHRLRPAHYAFIRDGRNTIWDRQREEAFRELAHASGIECTVIAHAHDLAERLAALPKPCGILGATDMCARQAIDAANQAGIPIPQDLQVIGIDNYIFACEHASPTLSSVHPDFEGCGYLAMATLDRIMNGSTAHPRTILYGPKETVRRSSTRQLGHYNARVVRALDFIAAHYADTNLNSETIAAAMGCSRTLADLRFRQTTGRSIRQQIRETRLEAAKRLLKDGSYELKAIPSLCGYRSATTFMRLFKAETGSTMLAWQASGKSTGLPKECRQRQNRQ